VPILSGFSLIRSPAGYLDITYIKGKGKGRKGLAFGTGKGRAGSLALAAYLSSYGRTGTHTHGGQSKEEKRTPPGGVEQCGMDIYPPLATHVTNPSKFFSPLKGRLWFRLSERNKYPIG